MAQFQFGVTLALRPRAVFKDIHNTEILKGSSLQVRGTYRTFPSRGKEEYRQNEYISCGLLTFTFCSLNTSFLFLKKTLIFSIFFLSFAEYFWTPFMIKKSLLECIKLICSRCTYCIFRTRIQIFLSKQTFYFFQHKFFSGWKKRNIFERNVWIYGS